MTFLARDPRCSHTMSLFALCSQENPATASDRHAESTRAAQACPYTASPTWSWRPWFPSGSSCDQKNWSALDTKFGGASPTDCMVTVGVTLVTCTTFRQQRVQNTGLENSMRRAHCCNPNHIRPGLFRLELPKHSWTRFHPKSSLVKKSLTSNRKPHIVCSNDE